MRLLLTSAAALIAGALLVGGGTASTTAAPLPSMASFDATSPVVQKVDWRRRYYRQNGVWPPVSVPRAVIEQGVDEDVIVVPDEPVVKIFPARPVSCGEFRYWDGERCVDARYNNPYLGPR